MSAIDDLIAKTRQIGLYPFVYSVESAGPGALIDRAPHYVVYGNIFSPEYGLPDGTHPISTQLRVAATTTSMAEPTQNAAQIADIFISQTFTSKSDVALAYQGTTVDTALDIGFKYASSMKVAAAGLVQLSYPGVDRNSLAAAFNQPSVINAPASSALGQVVRDMKTRGPVFVFGPRPLDIAQFVIAARGLRLTWTSTTQLSASLRADLQALAAKALGNFKLGASTDVNSVSTITAEWQDMGKPMPVLWYPWRYAWDGSKFETVSV